MGTPPPTRWTLKDRLAPADSEAARWPAVIEDQAGRYVGSFFVADAADVPTVVAAPELLEALSDLLGWCESLADIGRWCKPRDGDEPRAIADSIARARAVVAKATGGLP